MIRSKTKQCTKCLEIKPLDEFHLANKTPTGRKTVCKACCAKDASIRSANKPKDAVFFTPEIRDAVFAQTLAEYREDPEYWACLPKETI